MQTSDDGRRLVSFPVPHGFCVLTGHLTRASLEHAIAMLTTQLAAFPGERPADGHVAPPHPPTNS